ncbi:MAG: BatA domain-containing protein [Planctomycetes bacterium]|nr:BatA domain-containing protein [Planctomycetota bacterium]
MGSLFLHPALLWGLLALAVPILLHFLFRRPEQRIRWAAMDLLRRAVETTAKRSRRRERWLLALRIAVLALLALAFASPLVRDSGVLRVLGADGAPVVLVIDGSLSMQARAATGESAFETARARAIDVVRSTPRGSPTSVVLACAAPRVVVRDEVSRDEVEAALRSLQGTSLGDDDAATARLVDSLAQGARTIWFSDFAGRDRGAAFPAERLSVAVSDSGNAAIESLDVAREPGIAGPLRVTAVVRRFGPARQREISLGVDGVEKERRRIDLAENEVARVTFDLAVDDPGFHEVRAQLDADTRPFDDARSSVIHVRAPLRVRVFEPVGASPHLDAALRAV